LSLQPLTAATSPFFLTTAFFRPPLGEGAHYTKITHSPQPLF
jgi:hypothetical protein